MIVLICKVKRYYIVKVQLKIILYNFTEILQYWLALTAMLNCILPIDPFYSAYVSFPVHTLVLGQSTLERLLMEQRDGKRN